MSENETPGEIGYGKPPKSGQFKKWKSGNPKGRPKGSKNFATVVLREARQRVRVNGPRGTRTVTKLEAQGKLPSTREFVAWVEHAEVSVNAGAAPLSTHEMDQRVMETIRRRMGSLTAEPVSGSESTSEEE
jgi:hypothetical protein